MPENESGFNPSTKETDIAPKEGDIKIVNGKTYHYEKSRYTLRQFYSHSTPEMGAGPGWDFKTELLDNDWAMKNFGRTFSIDEVFNPRALPDLPIYHWKMIQDKM